MPPPSRANTSGYWSPSRSEPPTTGENDPQPLPHFTPLLSDPSDRPAYMYWAPSDLRVANRSGILSPFRSPAVVMEVIAFHPRLMTRPAITQPFPSPG